MAQGPSPVQIANRAFRKHSSNRRNLKAPASRFRVDRKHILKSKFCENDEAMIIVISNRVLLKYRGKMTDKCCVFKFLWLCVNRKHSMHFQSETSVVKFFQRSVNGSKMTSNSILHPHIIFYVASRDLSSLFETCMSKSCHVLFRYKPNLCLFLHRSKITKQTEITNKTKEPQILA